MLNLMSISLVDHFEKFFNAFELIIFIRHFCDTRIFHVFWDINERLIVTVIEWVFFATVRGSQCINFMYVTESCFCVIFKSHPSLLKSPEFLTPGVLRYTYNTTALKNPSPADYLATPFSPLLNFSALALHCSYLKSNIYICSKFFHIYRNYYKGVISTCYLNYHIILSY